MLFSYPTFIPFAILVIVGSNTFVAYAILKTIGSNRPHHMKHGRCAGLFPPVAILDKRHIKYICIYKSKHLKSISPRSGNELPRFCAQPESV